MLRAFHYLTVLAVALPLLMQGGDVSAQATHLVTQQNRQFGPTTLTVKAGDTVIFRNDDAIAHHVVSHTPQFPFDLDLQPPGTENMMTFTKAGTVIVSCDIHPRMEVAITVQE